MRKVSATKVMTLNGSTVIRWGTAGLALLALGALATATRAQDQKVIVGVRPQNVAVGARSAASDAATVPAQVEVLEPIGHESIVYAKAGSERLVSIVGPHVTARHGDAIGMTIDLAALHLFDAESEARIDPDPAKETG